MGTRKIVINTCYGGFNVSEFALAELRRIKNDSSITRSCDIEGDRTDPDLISLIEEHGLEKISEYPGELKVIEIPDNVEWEIKEYDGNEHIAEKHRTWS